MSIHGISPVGYQRLDGNGKQMWRKDEKALLYKDRPKGWADEVYSYEMVILLLEKFLDYTNDSVPEQQGGYDLANERWISSEDIINQFINDSTKSEKITTNEKEALEVALSALKIIRSHTRNDWSFFIDNYLEEIDSILGSNKSNQSEEIDSN